jgi:hypothetical protein
MRFTRAMFGGHASFDVDGFGFMLRCVPFFVAEVVENSADVIPLGRYKLSRHNDEARWVLTSNISVMRAKIRFPIAFKTAYHTPPTGRIRIRHGRGFDQLYRKRS